MSIWTAYATPQLLLLLDPVIELASSKTRRRPHLDRRLDLTAADGATQLATEKLFKPLGIDTRNAYTARFRPDDVEPFENAGFGWATDAQGINSGCLLRLRPGDMLKFGQLYLDHGKWHRQTASSQEVGCRFSRAQPHQ
jgi:hypothetical protein